MGGKKNSKEDVNVSSAESNHSGNSSEDSEEQDYVVERVVDKKVSKNGKVCNSVFFFLFQ